MAYLILKVIHLTSLALTFMGLAGVLAVSAVSPGTPNLRRTFMVFHGIGLVILLLTGFAMAGQLGIGKNLPAWIWGKVIIWLLAGASPFLARRWYRFPLPILLWFSALVACAAWLALFKP